MMTQDRATGQPMAHEVNEDISITPASPRLLNLNPTAQPFRQTPSGTTPPKNLNPSAPVFQQSGDRSPSDGGYLGQEAGSPGIGNNDSGDNQPVQPNGALLGGGLPGQTVVGGEDEAEEGEADSGISEGIRYPASVLEPIKKQMQFYFSAENLPNDKFLNSKMDNDKYIPLDLFLDFNRIKPICSSFEQLAQAVESSSILELNENRTKVRVSQCRKTLTLRGFPASASEDDIRQFILDMGASPPTHIEFVMVKDKCSTFYVSFKDETIALNCFFRLHNTKAEYRGYPIGCCIKSSGTLAAAGYFPSSEESTQRRMAHQNHVSVSTVNHTATTPVQNTLPPQPQQPQTLMQSYNTVPIYNQIMPATTGSYYHVTAPYMPYMTSMIAPGWPGPTAMEPGIIMQSNGLQPQHIRTNMARPQIVPHSAGNQRFNKPQRNNRQQPLERSASERSSDRGSVVSVSTSGQSRSSPRNIDVSTNASIVQQSGGGYVQRRSRDDVTQVINPQQIVTTGQFVTPLVSQQPQQHVVPATPAAIANATTAEGALHFQPAQPQQNPIIVQPAITVPTTVPPLPTPQTNNPPPLAPQQQMPHHQPPHHQPPPPLQIHPHHQQQPSQPPHHHHHHQQQQPAHHQQPHPVSHHQPPPPPPPPPQTHHQPHHQQPLQGGNHQPHTHSMMPPPHHQQSSHHQMPPPASHHQQHQQPPLRTERRRKNRKDDGVRSQRNQPSRVNFSSQVPATADNFTMEANSFPPLPGAANSVTSSEVSHENKMSDIVRGKPPRTSVSSGSGVQRAPSTTPSPVTTPAPATVASSAPTLHQRVTPSAVDAAPIITDDVDSLEDEDSQEEVDTDESRSIRSDTQSVTSSEPSSTPVQSRSQKASTPVATSAPASAHRQADNRQNYNQVSVQNRMTQQPTQQIQQQQMSPVQSTGISSLCEAPKPSYAQMVAQKNREAANGVTSGDITNSGSLNTNPNSGSVNGPTNTAQGNNNTAPSNTIRSTNQSSNNFREQSSYQASGQQPGPRSAQRGSSKDNSARTEGPPPSSRPPSNGSRRNSKENRSSNKFERRKPDTRPK